MTPQRLKQLEKRIREFVPEITDPNQFGCRIEFDFEMSDGTTRKIREFVNNEYELEDRVNMPRVSKIEILGVSITLEHCIVALRRSNDPWVKIFNSVEYEDEASYCLPYIWMPLKPWESQHEAHEFLAKYLLTDEA